jgi:predicted nucleic acid-binding protein
MSLFIDTGVFYAHHDTDADRHSAAVAIFDEILAGEYGQPYTNEYILDEAITLTRTRTDSFEAASTIAQRIRGQNGYPPIIELCYTGPEDLTGALEMFRRYQDHDLSFTDAMIVHCCESRGFDAVCSFDSDFDGLVDRIEPEA